MVQLRKSQPELVYGEYRLRDRGSSQVFAYTRSLEGRALMIALSFSAGGGRTDMPAGYVAGKS